MLHSDIQVMCSLRYVGTRYSVLNRSPAELVEDIILVDVLFNPVCIVGQCTVRGEIKIK